MANPSLSIIIPTHHRPDILKICLAHLAAQTIAKDIEVIVVHDGEDDAETQKIIHEAKSYHLKAIRYFSIPKSQQGIARNEGVTHAKSPIVLFIGDDIFLMPDACEVHVRMHQNYELRSSNLGDPENQNSKFKIQNSHPIAVLGFTTWDPQLDLTPVMQWLEKTGWQFGYPMIERFKHAFIPRDTQERFTYTSNISVPLTIAKQFPFRADATLYGWEDILWGKQLKEANIPLFYEPDAKALHHHRITMDDSLKRMETLGRSLVQLTKIDPDLGRMPTGIKMIAYRLIALTPTMRGAHYRAFLRGIQSAR
ncbi:MAG TPA: glycosyltransferase [Candidatus Peribacteraceae bacterium]|nr:glycosyltransferase [Candidatus Peribacteraceae bacterium]